MRTYIGHIATGNRKESNNNFSSLVTASRIRGAISFRSSPKVEGDTITRKGLLVPVIMSAFQGVGYWLEVITLPFKLSNIMSRRRASILRFNQIETYFRRYGKFSVRSFSRDSTSKEPSRINSEIVNIYTEYLHVNAFGIYEQLRITYKGGIVKRITQPILVVAHSSKVSWRDVITEQDVSYFHLDTSKVKAYFADEFDKVYTWDSPLRAKIKKRLIPYLEASGFEIAKVPMDELREAIIYKPDFSKLDPFAGNRKMLRDVETIDNYYTPLR